MVFKNICLVFLLIIDVVLTVISAKQKEFRMFLNQFSGVNGVSKIVSFPIYFIVLCVFFSLSFFLRFCLFLSLGSWYFLSQRELIILLYVDVKDFLLIIVITERLLILKIRFLMHRLTKILEKHSITISFCKAQILNLTH